MTIAADSLSTLSRVNCAGEGKAGERGPADSLVFMRVFCAMHAPVLRPTGNTRNTNYFLLNSGKETKQEVMIKSWKAEIIIISGSNPPC